MKNQKILVCGSTGFMGRNIVEYFSKLDGYDVYGVGHKNPDKCFLKDGRRLNWDLTTQEGVDGAFSAADFDIVIQAAATTSGSKDTVERPYYHVTDNAIINSRVLQACYDHNVGHFLFLSCGVMYNPERSPVTEKDFYLDDGIFKDYIGVGWTKVYIEKMCEFFATLGRTKHTAIRHTNTYGPYDKYDLENSHMFGATITKVAEAKDGDTITVWGDGTTERDLLHVEDVCSFIHKAILGQETACELYNVGYGSCFSVTDIVQKIINASGKNIKITYDASKPTIKTKLALISDKARGELGWSPHISLDEGIRRTMAWYKENIQP